MGNCQAAEVSTAVIENPSSSTHKVERLYWSVSASDVMSSHPGHYVAMVITSSTMTSEGGTAVKQLKLLRPDDTLLLGRVYRLVSFEDVLKDFAAKKCVRLGKLLSDNSSPEQTKEEPGDSSRKSEKAPSSEEKQDEGRGGDGIGSLGSIDCAVMRRYYGGKPQWRPVLQSIAEFGI